MPDLANTAVELSTPMQINYLTAEKVFNQNDGETTKMYYASLCRFGLMGELAVAVFRAQKRSAAAKPYKSRRYTAAAYDVKNWSLSEVCRIASKLPRLAWGWKRDPHTPGYEWVLYVELPTGQVSFHCPQRLTGPDFAGEWDGIRGVSPQRVFRFCDQVAASGCADA